MQRDLIFVILISGVLIEALSDGLAAADALSLTRMALVAPVGESNMIIYTHSNTDIT